LKQKIFTPKKVNAEPFPELSLDLENRGVDLKKSFCSGTFSINESFYEYSVNQNDLFNDLPND
jgi:hypothetical protein